MAKTTVNLCVLGCPLPPYIKEQGGGRSAVMGRSQSRIPTRNPIPSRFPTREERGKEGEGEREKERGVQPPFPCPIRTQAGRARLLRLELALVFLEEERVMQQ